MSRIATEKIRSPYIWRPWRPQEISRVNITTDATEETILWNRRKPSAVNAAGVDSFCKMISERYWAMTWQPTSDNRHFWVERTILRFRKLRKSKIFFMAFRTFYLIGSGFSRVNYLLSLTGNTLTHSTYVFWLSSTAVQPSRRLTFAVKQVKHKFVYTCIPNRLRKL